MQVVVLDGHQRCAHVYADWDRLDADVRFEHEHLSGDTLVAPSRASAASRCVARRAWAARPRR